jgi:hypothetical protein
MNTTPQPPLRQTVKRHAYWNGRLCEAPPEVVVQSMTGDALCNHAFLAYPTESLMSTMIVGFKWTKGHTEGDVWISLSPQRMEETSVYVRLEVPPPGNTALVDERVCVDQLWKCFYRTTARRVWDALLREGWVPVPNTATAK